MRSCHVLVRVVPDEPSSRLLSWAAGAWRTYDVSPPPGQVTGLACRTGECVIVDSAYSIVDDSDEPSNSSALHGLGAQWERRPMVNPLGLPPDTVPFETTCPVRGWCLALGLDGNDDEYVLRRTAGQWRRLPAALAVQRDLDCWRRSACVVAGSDGTRPRAARLLRGRWRVTPALRPAWMARGTLSGIGCAGSRCAYSGYYEARGRAGWGTFVAVRDRGTWQAERVGPLVPYENWISARPSMDCPTAGSCVVVFSSDTRGANGTIPVSYEAVLQDGRWRTAVIGRGFSLFEIDCSEARHCIAGGEEGRPGLVMSRRADGAWRTVPVATRDAAFYSVSCPSARECRLAGTGSKVVHLARTGDSWRARRSGPRDMTDIACPGRRWCLTFNADSTWVGS